MRRLTGGTVEEILRVDRHPHAVYQPKVPRLAFDDEGMVLAGSYLGAAAMKDAIASGFTAGRRAVELAQRTPAWSRSHS